MAQLRVGGFLFKRSVKKLVEGAELEWRGDETVAVVNSILERIGKVGAAMVARTARRIVAAKAYNTGDLRDSIKAEKSRYRNPIEVGSPVTEYLITAGDNQDVDYAFQVETGRYYKDTETRVPAVPFMRGSFSKNKRKIRQMFINRLRQRLS
jgi:hypothetical protein